MRRSPIVLTISHTRMIASAISAIRHQEGRLVPVDWDDATSVAVVVGVGATVAGGEAAGLAVGDATAADSAALPEDAESAGGGAPAATFAGARAADSNSLVGSASRAALMAAGGLVEAGFAPSCGWTSSEFTEFEDVLEFIVDGACTAICT